LERILWRGSFGEDPLERILWRGSFGEDPLERILWRGSFGEDPFERILWRGSFPRSLPRPALNLRISNQARVKIRLDLSLNVSFSMKKRIF
jgi:hypothetical protein